MKYKLKCTNRFPRNFYRNGIAITTFYERWTILDEEGKFIRYWDVTEDSYLANFLGNLVGHKEAYEFEENKLIIFETIFAHTNRWKIFSKAWDLLNKKGSEKALEYLYDTFSVIALGDRLDGKK